MDASRAASCVCEIARAVPWVSGAGGARGRVVRQEHNRPRLRTHNAWAPHAPVPLRVTPARCHMCLQGGAPAARQSACRWGRARAKCRGRSGRPHLQAPQASAARVFARHYQPGRRQRAGEQPVASAWRLERVRESASSSRAFAGRASGTAARRLRPSRSGTKSPVATSTCANRTGCFSGLCACCPPNAYAPAATTQAMKRRSAADNRRRGAITARARKPAPVLRRDASVFIGVSIVTVAVSPPVRLAVNEFLGSFAPPADNVALLALARPSF
jgi:hypothetical protein